MRKTGAVIYGIANCDTMKKARAWLAARDLDVRFHDYRKDGVDPDMLRRWTVELGWEALLNRSGTTFRRLADADKAGLDADKAIALMAAYTSLIRRPVLDDGRGLLVGFRPEAYRTRFG